MLNILVTGANPFTLGKNKYDFIDVDELANQIACLAEQAEMTGIINCRTGIPVFSS